jgi:hypothetical protein
MFAVVFRLPSADITGGCGFPQAPNPQLVSLGGSTPQPGAGCSENEGDLREHFSEPEPNRSRMKGWHCLVLSAV